MSKVTVFKHVEEERRDPIKYTGCGLDDVYLVSGYERRIEGDEEIISIRDLSALHKAIGRYIVDNKKRMSGKEIRFLRTYMRMTQSDLGWYLGYSDQQVARWEKEQSVITEPADRLLRLLFRDHIGSSPKVRRLIDSLKNSDDTEANATFFKRTRTGWHTAA